ncbi:MAG: hypothetical protein ABF479_09515 [Gluconacetobacter sp.]|uniref:Uncharacterized protein n=1 Tax=Gluconacetobacter dulcium TaxID=2729096 RepID=A0A7W4K393_9PROT|nr:hypothetical protein [Gluconacetobacter dulcium]MBB2199367.1 hypothetical protein [Gluconacetobacter dulcium]
MSCTSTPSHDRIIGVTKGALHDVNLALSGLTLLLGQMVDTEGDVSADIVMDWAHALHWLRDSIKTAIASPQKEIAAREAGP